jgi:hypothetical protein
VDAVVKRPHQKFDLVEVWWEDASDAEPGWVKDIDTDEPALALSVGFLVKQTKERIYLAQDLDAEGHHNGRGKIPRGMVRKIKVIRKKDPNVSG